MEASRIHKHAVPTAEAAYRLALIQRGPPSCDQSTAGATSTAASRSAPTVCNAWIAPGAVQCRGPNGAGRHILRDFGRQDDLCIVGGDAHRRAFHNASGSGIGRIDLDTVGAVQQIGVDIAASGGQSIGVEVTTSEQRQRAVAI